MPNPQPRGDLITAAIEKALKEKQVDENGRPLTEWVAWEALELKGVAFMEGDRRGLDEVINREMRKKG